jgi:rod shape-determining protein MreC
LRQQHEIDTAQLLQLQTMHAENQQLRKLLALPERAGYSTRLAQIIASERDVFKRKILISKGSMADVQAGQIVLDDNGIVGQITRVYPWSSEVTLITEKDHAVPVEVLRNGLRTIVFGTGNTSNLTMRYMPVSADIQVGDVLVTSGIDEIYPPGIPVAHVIKIERDPAYPFARIVCLPLAGVDRHHHLLILSGTAQPPALPVEKPNTTDSEPGTRTRREK